jgi:hypothetical protein
LPLNAIRRPLARFDAIGTLSELLPLLAAMLALALLASRHGKPSVRHCAALSIRRMIPRTVIGGPQDDTPGEPATITAPDAKQIIADAIRLRDQSQYAAEDMLAGLKKAGCELRKK